MALLNSHVLKAEACTEFHSFPLFPSEIRIQIWKLSFIPRRLLMWSASERPALDLLIGKFLLVNSEAKQIFLENYTRCFHQKGQKATYLNFDIDTLTFRAGIKSFQKMIRHYPADMARVQRVDVPAFSLMCKKDSTSFKNDSMRKMESLKHITVRVHRFGAHTNDYRSFYEWQLYKVAKRIRKSLLRVADPNKPYNGPQLAIIFPRNEDWNEHMYLTTCKDLNTVNYGRLVWQDEVEDGWGQCPNHRSTQFPEISPTWLPLDNFNVTWSNRDVPWPIESYASMRYDGCLPLLNTGRTMRNRQEMRDFWKHISTYDDEHLNKAHLIDREYDWMGPLERKELYRVVHTLTDIRRGLQPLERYEMSPRFRYHEQHYPPVTTAAYEEIVLRLSEIPFVSEAGNLQNLADILTDCRKLANWSCTGV